MKTIFFPETHEVNADTLSACPHFLSVTTSGFLVKFHFFRDVGIDRLRSAAPSRREALLGLRDSLFYALVIRLGLTTFGVTHFNARSLAAKAMVLSEIVPSEPIM